MKQEQLSEPLNQVWLMVDVSQRVVGVDTVMGDIAYTLQADEEMASLLGRVWDAKTKTLVDYVPTAEEAIAIASQAIADHIYNYYPEQKQNEDKSYIIVNKDIIVALSDIPSDQLTKDLVLAARNYLAKGIQMESFVASCPIHLKDRYERLYKVTCRLAWCDACVTEGKKAIDEQRQPSYREFPQF